MGVFNFVSCRQTRRNVKVQDPEERTEFSERRRVLTVPGVSCSRDGGEGSRLDLSLCRCVDNSVRGYGLRRLLPIWRCFSVKGSLGHWGASYYQGRIYSLARSVTWLDRVEKESNVRDSLDRISGAVRTVFRL